MLLLSSAVYVIVYVPACEVSTCVSLSSQKTVLSTLSVALHHDSAVEVLQVSPTV
ncbi:hypothetical protein P5915_08850 [Acholeplasma manati]|nr:hypothetical protein [Paracholeplasma manati]MDG0889489.1 hypothetical protein [Paracholeplasma manati]